MQSVEFAVTKTCQNVPFQYGLFLEFPIEYVRLSVDLSSQPFECRDHPAVIKRRFTSVLIVSTLSPVFVWAWKEFTGIRVSNSIAGVSIAV